MSHKLTRQEVDVLTLDEEFFSDIYDLDSSEQDKERFARRARKNHVRRSIEDHADTRRMRKMLNDFY